jgi:ectoine hydroxylase-related dioxygenase (phytanoyl-CoA dioxygenase family)
MNFVAPQAIFDGKIQTFPIVQESLDLLDYVNQLVKANFGCDITAVKLDSGEQVTEFVRCASATKTAFTDGANTRPLLKKLIQARYSPELLVGALVDPPRLRIIPNSAILNSGISYNYMTHRDTWYGGVHEQINHWMAVANVTANSTMYMAPKYFNTPVDNNSEIFDLDTWDQKYRKQAIDNIKIEARPHPGALITLADEDQEPVVLDKGNEIAFSGHHLHGSQTNTTNLVRFSLDYRVVLAVGSWQYPANIDNRATGDLRNYMYSLE